MGEQQPPPQEGSGRAHSAAGRETRAGTEQGVKPAEFVKFLAGQLDQHGKPPVFAEDDIAPDHTIMRVATIKNRKGNKSITLIEISDPKTAGLRYEVVDDAGYTKVDHVHDAALQYKNDSDEVIALKDLSDLQREILELQEGRGKAAVKHIRDRWHKMSMPKRVAAVGVAAAVGLGALGIGSMSGGSETPAPPQGPGIEGPAVPGPQPEAKDSAFEKREQQARAELDQMAKNSARGVLLDMDNPKAGTENYAQTRVGNKAAVVGPDGNMDTPDDAKYKGVPEMFAVYNPDTGQLEIRSVSMYDTKGHDSFTAVDTAFSVDPNSKIAQNPDQLTTADFRAALDDPNTKFLGGSWQNQSDGNPDTINSTVAEDLGVDVRGDRIRQGSGVDGSMAPAEVMEGTPPEKIPGMNPVNTIDGLNVLVFQATTAADTASKQLSSDTNGGNR
jgi:hypothetical protein